MKLKITRRKLAAAALGSAGGLRTLVAQTVPEDLDAAAREQIRKTSETLAKTDLPMATEPAFQFKV